MDTTLDLFSKVRHFKISDLLSLEELTEAEVKKSIASICEDSNQQTCWSLWQKFWLAHQAWGGNAPGFEYLSPIAIKNSYLIKAVTSTEEVFFFIWSGWVEAPGLSSKELLQKLLAAIQSGVIDFILLDESDD